MKKKPKPICTCPKCRRSIRLLIEVAFLEHPGWMGQYTIRFVGELGWVPVAIYKEVLAEMVLLGQVVKLNPPDREYPIYLLSRLTLPAAREARTP